VSNQPISDIRHCEWQHISATRPIERKLGAKRGKLVGARPFGGKV